MTGRSLASIRWPVFAWHHDVEQDQFGLFVQQQAAGRGRTFGLAHGKALADEIFRQGLAQVRFVVDQQ